MEMNKIPGLPDASFYIDDVGEITILPETESHDGGGGTDFERIIDIKTSNNNLFKIKLSSHNANIAVKIKKSDVEV